MLAFDLGKCMIVVTGASGLLGASVVLHARDLGREVAGICHSHAVRIPEVPTYCVDLTNADATRALVRQVHPEAIIHCAAAANVDWCEDHPQETKQINVDASSVLAEMAAEANAAFLYVSTDSVFDGQRGDYSESDEPHPINVYAWSKLHGEHQVSRYKPDAIVARVNIYGWNAQDKQSLAEWILARLLAGNQVPGFTDVFSCPMLVNDLAEVLMQMVDARLSGVYHVVAREKLSKYDFARRLAVTYEVNPDLVIPARLADAKLRAARPHDVSLNTAKIETTLGRRMPDVASGLSRFRSLHDAGYSAQMKALLTGASA